MKCLEAALLVISGLVPLAATMAPAGAATVTFDWTLSGPSASLGGVPFPGSGTITATTSSQGDMVTAITGTVGGSAIIGLTMFDGSDNLLFPNAKGTSLLDGKGISFGTAAGQDINIFGFFAPGQHTTGNAYAERTNQTGGFGVGAFALTPVAATPLPPTWTMMILGLCGLGFFAARGTKKYSTALEAT
jgi:hypothetical protein